MRTPNTGHIRNRFLAPVLAGVFAFAALLGCAGPAVGDPGLATHTGHTVAAQPNCGDTSSYKKVDLSTLPKEATDTVNLIKKGGPYPYPQDGTVFSNREGILPKCDSGYYHEFTVKTPGSDDRGARRFVTGKGSEYFYTDDHYKSFSLVNVGA
ncbi:ribonuclease domain-containing protein [Sciscionella marina]|uniref:ribonuclease domain-containing protein n=1 Tax=Sciscionella marina TaxID=508770 RepID=UPI00037F83FF|nr:ribonuclease domain-containing protein [Sciscionella marina]